MMVKPVHSRTNEARDDTKQLRKYAYLTTNVAAMNGKISAGDPIPPNCAVIEVHVGELRQLFDAIDPSPFRDRDLDPKAEEFIVGWAKDLPRDAALALVVDLAERQVCPTRRLFCVTQFTSSSGTGLRIIDNDYENCFE